MNSLIRNTLSIALSVGTLAMIGTNAIASDSPVYKLGSDTHLNEYRAPSKYDAVRDAARHPSSVGNYAADLSNERASMRYPADNTGRNAYDTDDLRVTADDQNMSSKDVALLARIRKDVTNNDALSTYGKNVKIIVQNSVITLRGPVKSVEEKNWIEQTARRDSAGYTVINQLEVTQ